MRFDHRPGAAAEASATGGGGEPGAARVLRAQILPGGQGREAERGGAIVKSI